MRSEGGIFIFDNGSDTITVHNTLMYRCHNLLFGNAPLETQIGFAGPVLQLETERPVDWTTEDLAMGPRLHLSDFEGNNDGGLPSSDMQVMENYARQSVTWSISKDGLHGVIQDTGWYTWTSRISWTQHGSTKPDLYDEDNPTGPKYLEPYKWVDAYPYEAKDQDYPWATPFISDWWAEGHDYIDHSSVTHHVDAQSGWADAPTFNELGIWGTSMPISHVYVAIRVGGDWQIMAASETPTAWWRRSGVIRCRYISRWG